MRIWREWDIINYCFERRRTAGGILERVRAVFEKLVGVYQLTDDDFEFSAFHRHRLFSEKRPPFGMGLAAAFERSSRRGIFVVSAGGNGPL